VAEKTSDSKGSLKEGIKVSVKKKSRSLSGVH